ncbi:hypothetical protein UFOVP299_27 [uncultured Caudovirales phage]|uniref:Uncharacterized protein n=1 Tax=uncultured Caudovirales phage TaxID=2100421 RepID=A0A6J5LT86_9CAUD|nr:hypothetical protein UFOVP299_27 [uncultured Caudovirales phage]
MKNIHILPTDKPSRLYEGNLGKPVTIQSASAQLKKPLNIYITSDEEIKEGDWFISLYSNSIQRELKLDWTLNKDAYKKIILTTDQDLIKDGVQAIDDEFLKWFVKNPSCEEVEVAKTNKLIDNYADKDEDKWEVKYHIYLPKEEPKQETLEEAAKGYAEANKFLSDRPFEFNRDLVAFINGAKWQQEQIGKSEFLQRLRGTLSDAEARRLIFETFKNK